MYTRMEKVARDVALKVLLKSASAAQRPLQPEMIKEAFLAEWPLPDSNAPMKDAMRVAARVAGNCSGQSAGTWETAVSQQWQAAVEEVVEEYFKAAHASFEKREPLEGVEILTDAVRATLGHIAAVRDWPHGSHDDLYRIAAALGSGSEWPNTPEEFSKGRQEVEELAAQEGRDAKSIVMSVRVSVQFQAPAAGGSGSGRAVPGYDPDGMTAAMAAYKEAGVQHMVLGLNTRDVSAITRVMESVAGDVMPRLE